ncbi:MAG: hypothetical protein E7294_03630 [Lachnospiraceae bacterium]|jgi:hypothetical protein|nr:hypothetical protein [Lachnospiraceae bacterium]
MAGVIYDASRIKAYAVLEQLCECAGEKESMRDLLWQEFLGDEELYEEFVYYAQHHTIQGKMKVAGYTLLDLFVQEMDSFNLTHDTGKNTAFCNKEDMVLRAFLTMAGLKREPEKYKERFDRGFGMDRI